MFFRFSPEEFAAAARWAFSSDDAISITSAIWICQMVRERNSTFSQWFVTIDESTITFSSNGDEFTMFMAGSIHAPAMAFSINGRMVSSPEEWVTAFISSINS